MYLTLHGARRLPMLSWFRLLTIALLAALVVVACWMAGLCCPVGDFAALAEYVDRERAKGEKLDRRVLALQRRHEQRDQIREELLAGRLTFSEAAEGFRQADLETGTPSDIKS